jgi:hypothetical protein
MEIPISYGEWIHSLGVRMNSAAEGDCFLLPTPMHFHAYELVKESQYPEKNFRVVIGSKELV